MWLVSSSTQRNIQTQVNNGTHFRLLEKGLKMTLTNTMASGSKIMEMVKVSILYHIFGTVSLTTKDTQI
jgi:hypothetical protein